MEENNSKRAKRNRFAAIAVIVLMVAALAGTTFLYKKNNSMPAGQQAGGQPPTQMQQDDSSSSSSGSSDSSSQSDSQTPPEKPDGEPADMQEHTTSPIYYVAYGAEAFALFTAIAYLLLSKGGKNKLDKKQIAALLAVSIMLGGGIGYGAPTAMNKLLQPDMTNGHQPGGQQGEPSNQQSSDVEAIGVVEVDNETKTVSDDVTSEDADQNAVLVKNGGSATITGTINKKSGDSSNTESSDFSGVNAAVLVQENSSATIKGATIKTSAKGANAVFATGENSVINVSNTTIKTTGESSSRGLDATYGGTIKANNVTIETDGGSCATLATDRDEGTVTAKNSKLTTNGAGSPLIYSTGIISLSNSTGTANGSQLVVVEGSNSATVKNSKLTASGIGNRNDVDNAGVMIYQSMSGDAEEGRGTFTAKNSTLSISKDSKVYDSAPFFFVTNTKAVINLENNTLSYGSGTLLSACGTDEWGTNGSNGGKVTLNAANQKLTGDIVLDKLSTLKLNLNSGSSYKGTINGDDNASKVTLKLSKDSTISLTGDSYVDKLDDEDSTYSNINLNGHKLYVNGKAI